MDIFNKVFQTIFFKIPIEVLNIAFRDDIVNYNLAPISLEEKIKTEVIRERVLIDADIVGGETAIISLEGINPLVPDTWTMIYQIPPHLVNNRTIMSVLSIGYLPYTSSFNSMSQGLGSVNPRSMNDVLSAAQRVGDSFSNIPPISNASAKLIGYNTILVRDQLRITNPYQLRCVIGNEENLSNISPRSHLYFAELCIHAVKSYIYNKLIIKIDQAYLTGGQELGAIKDIVQSYSDAEENYNTYLHEVWRKVSFMSSPVDHERFLKLMINPGI